MNYSQNFITSVKVMYPNNKELHKALDDGELSVGEYLKEASETMEVTVKKSDVNENHVSFLWKLTKEFEERELLYLRWRNLIQFNSNS